MDELKKKHAQKMRIAMREHNYDACMEILKSEDIDFLRLVTPFGTWLHVAASFGVADIVRTLIELGLDVDIMSGTLGGGALNIAASHGHSDIVTILLENGAKLDISEPERNPLFSAIYGGHKEIVEMLIKSGIDTTVTYSGQYMSNMNAIDFAKERGQLEIAEVLAQHMACRRNE